MSWIIPILAGLGVFTGIFFARTDGKFSVEALKMPGIAAVAATLLTALLNYFVMAKTIAPVMAVLFLFFLLLALIPTMLVTRFFNDDIPKFKWIVAIGLVVILIVLFAYPTLNTRNLYELVDVEEEEGLPNGIDTSHLRQVNFDYARWKADKVVGELGNRVEIGELEIILYQGNLTWVGPLIHRGFWKWNEFGETPGYVLVDAQDPSAEAQLVSNYSLDMMYQGEYFGDYMHRVVYNDYPDFNQYWTFELDESGAPWIIVTLCKPEVMLKGDVPHSVLVISPVNGSSAIYDFGEQPVWVDNAFPEELAENYCDWWGLYKHGIWNAYVFGQKDVKIPTTVDERTDVYMIIGNDNRTFWYTDFTSPSGSDQSMIGYMLVDTKSGDFSFYESNGLLNGDAAKEAVTAKVKNFAGWYATQPMFLIIDGIETWFTPIHSGTNILQRVAFVEASTASVVIGDTLDEAYRDYIRMLQQTDDGTTGNVTGQLMLNGTLVSTYEYVVEGNTEWELNLDVNGTDQVVYAYSDTRPYVHNVGAVLSIEYYMGSSFNFDNVRVATSIL